MKRLLISAGTLVFVGALVMSATGAFFCDTETSTGNVFAAGAIDLLIDNESYVLDFNLPNPPQDPTGALVLNDATSWALRNLDECGPGDEDQNTIGNAACLFFNFFDLKPGDYGEDTISLHVQNDAWACMAMDLTGTPENVINEAEDEAGDITDDPNGGELQNYLSFVFWMDDGDNVFEDNETNNILFQGLASDLDGEWQAIAENGDTPLQAGETEHVGKFWCFGTIGQNPVAAAGDNNPIDDGTGFTCDGSGDNNDAQTDSIVVDVHFYAEQSRNNDQFSCSELPAPGNGEQRELVGAVLGDYEEPVCTEENTVDPGESIQDAIDTADPGDVICLSDGTHDTNNTYPIRVNKDDLTLAGENGPTNTAILTGGVILDNSGTTLTGVNIDGESTLLSETFGVYINTAATGATVSHNIIEGSGTNPSRGIVAATGLSGVTIAHNVISDWFTGVFLNPSSGMTVAFNTIFDNAVGSANDGPSGNSIHHNVIRDNTAEGVGVSDSTVGNGGSLNANFNNIYGNPAGNQMNNYDLGIENGGFEVDAENNWWGDDSPANNINASASPEGAIDFDPFETSAFPEN